MYELVFSSRAEKELQKLEKEILVRVIAVLERIRIRPELHLQKLVGQDSYKVRIGDYRAIVDLDKEKQVLFVLRVGHRRNVYDFPISK
jgi:mRNA interferase RelE/StbE